MSSANKVPIIVGVLTLITGTTTALIANWDKLFGKKEKAASSTEQVMVKSAQQDISSRNAANGEMRKFSGYVGKWTTNYDLTWYPDGRVEGRYFYFQRNTSDLYELKGIQEGESTLKLTEYINGKETADALLVKKDNCYTGKIKNRSHVNDGKMFDMSICE